jgi:CHAD domain-containing protein
VRNPPDLLVAEFASASLDRLRARLRKKGRHLRRQDDKALHKLRIAAKTLRYATEFFAGLFDWPEEDRCEEDFIKTARKLQDQLGELRDRAVAAALLEALRIPEEARPALPDRGPLLERTKRKFDELLECEPYWT